MPNRWLEEAPWERLRILARQGDDLALRAIKHDRQWRKEPHRTPGRRFHQRAFIRLADRALEPTRR